jgi:hypothetical protein
MPKVKFESNKIICFPNKDKSFQEKWYPGRDLLDIPWAFRAVFCGPPSSGKSTIVKNIIVKAKPMYKEVIVVHFGQGNSDKGGEDTADYDEIDGIKVVGIGEMPDPVKINPEKKKTLLVLEDVPLSHLNKAQKMKIDRLYGYASSHRGVSIITCAQDAFDVPVGARRSSNIFILWKQPDLLALQTMASRTGYTAQDFRELFKLCKTKHDSIMIDATEGTPAPLRFNCYTKIEIDRED